MNFDLGKQNAVPGAKLTVKTVKFEEKSVLVEDLNGVIYRSYYDKQPLWQTEGKPYLGVVGATLWGVVGDSTTPGGYLRFFVRKFISLPEPQQPTIPFDPNNDGPRSMYDVVSKTLDDTLNSIENVTATSPKFPPVCNVSVEEHRTHLQYVAQKTNKTKKFVANACLERGLTPMQFLANEEGTD